MLEIYILIQPVQSSNTMMDLPGITLKPLIQVVLQQTDLQLLWLLHYDKEKVWHRTLEDTPLMM